MDDGTRLAVLETKQTSHEKHDDERYGRIDSGMQAMTSMMSNLSRDVRDGVTRLHQRIDNEAAQTRKAIATSAAHVEGKIADVKKETDERIVELFKDVAETKATVSANERRMLIAIVLTLVSVLGFFLAQRFTLPDPAPIGAPVGGR